MKWITAIVPLIASTLLFAGTRTNSSDWHDYNNNLFSDTAKSEAAFASLTSTDNEANKTLYALENLNIILQEKKITQFQLGESQQGRKIAAYYIPGTSDQRALVLAGVHGSELSSVEVAHQLANRLMQGEKPFYSVVIIPSLFPDNALQAINVPAQIGSTANIGRYTYPAAVDPNRQMPSPGKDYDEHNASDHLGRKIEKENQLLLRLIREFKPQRIANVHAIRNTNYGGVYADPRTDHNGVALGYSSDSSLAIEMAAYIHQHGGNVEGNHLDKKATALYYKDPVPAPAGFLQKRNMTGSALNANRGSGVSLGTWGSTAINNDHDPLGNRDAIRIITIEYPGCKRPADYSIPAQQLFQQKQVEIFASAIHTFFLGNYFTENKNDELATR